MGQECRWKTAKRNHSLPGIKYSWEREHFWDASHCLASFFFVATVLWIPWNGNVEWPVDVFSVLPSSQNTGVSDPVVWKLWGRCQFSGGHHFNVNVWFENFVGPICYVPAQQPYEEPFTYIRVKMYPWPSLCRTLFDVHHIHRSYFEVTTDAP